MFWGFCQNHVGRPRSLFPPKSRGHVRLIFGASPHPLGTSRHRLGLALSFILGKGDGAEPPQPTPTRGAMPAHGVGLLSLPWAATGPQGWRPERVFSSTPARLHLYPPENCGPFPPASTCTGARGTVIIAAKPSLHHSLPLSARLDTSLFSLASPPSHRPGTPPSAFLISQAPAYFRCGARATQMRCCGQNSELLLLWHLSQKSPTAPRFPCSNRTCLMLGGVHNRPSPQRGPPLRLISELNCVENRPPPRRNASQPSSSAFPAVVSAFFISFSLHSETRQPGIRQLRLIWPTRLPLG